MSTATFGPTLIVWLGTHRYVFAPGRDVTVGVDGRADIRLDGFRGSGVPPLVMVHFNGTQWIAVDRSEAGIYVDGVRMSTVFIHDGRAITLGDPQHGPRLAFQLAAPPPPPPPPPPQVRPQPPQPPFPPPAPKRNVSARLTGAIQTLKPRRRKPQPHEAVPTTRLQQANDEQTAAPAPAPPAPAPPASTPEPPPPSTISGRLEARRVRLSIDGEQALTDLSFTASPGTITSVIGLSEASTSALVDVLAGAVQPSVGQVAFDGHDVASDDVRPHVAVVPRHGLLRPQLTVEQALRYAAGLRLPPSA